MGTLPPALNLGDRVGDARICAGVSCEPIRDPPPHEPQARFVSARLFEALTEATRLAADDVVQVQSVPRQRAQRNAEERESTCGPKTYTEHARRRDGSLNHNRSHDEPCEAQWRERGRRLPSTMRYGLDDASNCTIRSSSPVG